MAPVDPRVESLTLLRSIDASLKTLIRMQGASAPSGAVVASDADLDGQWGNPVIRAKDPRDWTGEPMKGRRFSECPADYLERLAARFDFFATRETDDKKIGYCRKDAARARGWAKRVREGRVPVDASHQADASTDSGEEWAEDPAPVGDWD